MTCLEPRRRVIEAAWSAPVLDAAFPSAASPQEAVHADPAAERHAIDTLFDLLDEFEKARSRYNGLQEIFLAYQACLQSENPRDSARRRVLGEHSMRNSGVQHQNEATKRSQRYEHHIQIAGSSGMN
jgi:hypothetical protein